MKDRAAIQGRSVDLEIAVVQKKRSCRDSGKNNVYVHQLSMLLSVWECYVKYAHTSRIQKNRSIDKNHIFQQTINLLLKKQVHENHIFQQKK